MKVSVTFRFSIFILMTMLSASAIVWGLSYLLIDILELTVINNPFGFFAMMLLSCTLLGFLLSLILGKGQMKGLNHVLDTLQKVGQGDFNATLSGAKVKQLNSIVDNFNAMVKQLQGIETLRSDFITSFSHEFKTPIVSIRGFAKLLKNENLSEQEKQNYLDIIISEANRLVLLSSNTLLLTSLENIEIIPEKAKFQLDEQIRNAILLFQSTWEQKHLNLKIDLEEVILFGNKDLIQQIWVNILSNAIKFSKEQGDIAVSLKQDLHHVYVAITDNGVGMEPETLKRIYDKFYQADASRTTKGIGLGLSITKRIITLCQGIIEITSNPNQGTTVLVTLPKASR